MTQLKRSLIIFIHFFFTSAAIYPQLNIGIQKPYSFQKEHPEILNAIEETIYSQAISQFQHNYRLTASYWPSSKLKSVSLSKIETLSAFPEFRDMDFLILPEIETLLIQKENDFYDPMIQYFTVELTLKIYIADIKKNTVIDEIRFILSEKDRSNHQNSLNRLYQNLSFKLKSWFDDLFIFKEKIRIVSNNKIWITLDKGRNSGLKWGDYLNLYQSDSLNAPMTVRIIKIDQESSTAQILYAPVELPENPVLVRQIKSDLEVQISGGVNLSNLTQPPILVLPLTSIKLFVPVGLFFFKPMISLDLNFFYRDNRLMIPFTLNGGFDLRYHINRFEFAAGLNAGVFFSPDLNYQLRADTAVITPNTRLSFIINTLLKFAVEGGYKFYIDDSFSRDWKTEIKGFYLLAGLHFTF